MSAAWIWGNSLFWGNYISTQYVAWPDLTKNTRLAYSSGHFVWYAHAVVDQDEYDVGGSYDNIDHIKPSVMYVSDTNAIHTQKRLH